MITTSSNSAIFNGENSEYFSDKTITDECFRRKGGLREHWQQLSENINLLGAEELQKRQSELFKLLQENGVTYNVYNDTDGLNRPWELDPIPLVISANEWKTIDQGLKQRAKVLDLLLNDLYGERRLLKNGILPPNLIYGHSGFLRPCDKINFAGKNKLILYGADLSRGPDGKVWLLKDRTQAPSGMGYALENRRTFNRAIPELFQGYHISRIGYFFNSLIKALQQIAPNGKEQPRIVLLTPGPRNETYFEHAYLASYLGITLVQGYDLVVREGFVWIKTIEGLEKVDVILRRVDDSYCDPLELREDSQLGVPGLLEAIRNGNVTVANPIGSGILENTGIMAFMHNIMQYFLNEEPILPMVATWWCGHKKEMDFVVNNLEKLVVKRTDRQLGSDTVIGNRLSSAQKTELINKIKAQPYLYVGQEEVGFSTAPVFTNSKLEPRLSVLRTYLVATNEGFETMAGGLTRCSPEKGIFLVSNQDGGISKDTWVECSETEIGKKDHFQYSNDLKRHNVLPSIAAENIYWVGRYSQRILRTSRFIRISIRNLNQATFGNNQESETNHALLKAVTHLTGTFPGFFEEEDKSVLQNPYSELYNVICDADKPGSILYNLNNLLRSMYSVRNRWTFESWRVLDDIEKLGKQLEQLPPTELRDGLSILDQLNIGLQAFTGMNYDSMYREDGWILYRFGKILENIALDLSQYSSLLTHTLPDDKMYKILEAVLVSNQNLNNYRSIYRSHLDFAPIMDLLFFNNQNPSSLYFQLNELLHLAEKLPAKNTSGDNLLSKQVFEMYSLLRLSSVAKIKEIDSQTGERTELHLLCNKLTDMLYKISVNLNANYFSHTIYQYQGSKTGQDFEV